MLQIFRVKNDRIINAQGSFIRYERCISTAGSEAVKVRADGQDLGSLLPGDAVRIPAGAVQWEIDGLHDSVIADFRIGIGEVESSRVFGEMTVVDAFSENITTGAASKMTVSAYSAEAIVTPEENKNGLIVRSVAVSVRAGAGGTAYMGLVAAKTAPTGFSAPMKRFNFLGAFESAGVLIDKLEHFNKRCPPGWGLWAVFQVQTAPAVANDMSVQYELLQ